MANNQLIIFDIWDYIKIRKKWWLLPLIILLLGVSILMFIGSSSTLSPLIYAMG